MNSHECGLPVHMQMNAQLMCDFVTKLCVIQKWVKVRSGGGSKLCKRSGFTGSTQLFD